MQVKTFEGFSMQDAVKAVRKELGKEAVILRTKEKPMENGKAKIFEITAALPDIRRHGGAGGGSSISALTSGDLQEFAAEIMGLKAAVNNFAINTPGRDRIANIESGMDELKTLMIQSLKGVKGSLYEGLNPNAADLVKKLELMSVDETSMANLVTHLKSLPDQPESGHGFAEQVFGDYYKAAAIKWMLGRIKIAPDFKSIADSMGVHVFVGATGGGKSSVVAKLAAHFHLKEKMKVVVCSCDGTRIAAHEQMRIYAKVIDTIFVPIESVEDIERVVSEHDDAQFIFIDTAGRSPKRNKLEDLMPFKNLNVPIDFHLVLSATDKEQQMDRTVRSFLGLGLSSLIFTKLDETWSYGEIFNLSQKWSVPLSYFGTGQGVPEDIERASKERVIERIFGL